MMTPILISQNVTEDPQSGERRDSLDHRWSTFLAMCGLLPVPVPNHCATARQLLTTVPAAGVLLSGGVDLAAYGGHAPERDEVEELLITWALHRQIPILGVCRGMQMLLHHYNADLVRVQDHTAVEHDIDVDGTRRTVNSYHQWAVRECPAPLQVRARAQDGVVEAVDSRELRLAGIMWHPERVTEPTGPDLTLFRNHFTSASCAR